MVLLSVSPGWFYGYDVILEMFYAIISLAVAALAFRIYRKTSQRNVGLFGASFFLIGTSYLIQSIINFLIISEINENICQAIKIQSVFVFNYLGMLVHVFFMTAGLSVLVYLTCRQEKARMLFLLMGISLSGIFLSRNITYAFYLFSTMFLSVICWHFISNHMRNKKSKTMLTAVAFLFLLFGNLHFIVSVNHGLFYVIGHLLGLVAYLLILTNYYLIRK
ncbi:MAG: hypothetical protein ABH879_00570 [archaeon]